MQRTTRGGNCETIINVDQTSRHVSVFVRHLVQAPVTIRVAHRKKEPLPLANAGFFFFFFATANPDHVIRQGSLGARTPVLSKRPWLVTEQAFFFQLEGNRGLIPRFLTLLETQYSFTIPMAFSDRDYSTFGDGITARRENYSVIGGAHFSEEERLA